MSSATVFLSLANNSIVPHILIPMPEDGSCLFHALAYSMNDETDTSAAFQVRAAIVSYVVQNWDVFEIYTCDENGTTYANAEEYSVAMMDVKTYGSVSELMAAGAIYPYTFEVYEGSDLRGSFGDGGLVKRLRFCGSFLNGHFDVLLPLDGLPMITYNP